MPESEYIEEKQKELLNHCYTKVEEFGSYKNIVKDFFSKSPPKFYATSELNNYKIDPVR